MKGSVSPLIEDRPIHTAFTQHVPFSARAYRHLLPIFPLAIERLDFRGFDLVVSCSHCVAKSVIVPEGVPHICYCLTPMRYAWDQFDAYFGPQKVGRLASGQMDVPRIAMNVAWFDESALPGQKDRPAVIAGHLDSPTGPAVFYKLRMLVPGDELLITYENGDRHVFVVDGKERYYDDDAPLSKIFGRNPGRTMNLITCDGAWDAGAANYQQRLVVYTRLKGS